MSRQVIWLPDAEAELTAIWMESPRRHEITNAAFQIDTALRRDALACGESREGELRIFFAAPLAISFVVKDDFVEVRHVWRIDRR